MRVTLAMCPNGHAQYEQEGPFFDCEHCGSMWTTEEEAQACQSGAHRVCPCGDVREPSDRFCGRCGTSLRDAALGLGAFWTHEAAKED